MIGVFLRSVKLQFDSGQAKTLLSFPSKKGAALTAVKLKLDTPVYLVKKRSY